MGFETLWNTWVDRERAVLERISPQLAGSNHFQEAESFGVAARTAGSKDFDTAFFFGDRSEYSIAIEGDKVLVTRDGVTDTLTGIEQLLFGAEPNSPGVTSFLVGGRGLVEQDSQPEPPGDNICSAGQQANGPAASYPKICEQAFSEPLKRPALGEFGTAVLQLTNAYRLANGMAPLETDARLIDAAEDWSRQMAHGDVFRHNATSRELDRRSYSWRSWGENIAAGYPTPKSVVEAWIDSPGHRANLLADKFRDIGVGYYHRQDDAGSIRYHHYWTLLFGAVFGAATN